MHARSVLLVAVVAAAFAGVAVLRAHDRAPTEVTPAATVGLPRLVDLGSDKCVACRAMVPVLDQLRSDHCGALDVVFIDVWKEPERAEPYGVRVIPTQIFVGPDGGELARHEGFLSAAEIEARFAELGRPLGGVGGSGLRR